MILNKEHLDLFQGKCKYCIQFSKSTSEWILNSPLGKRMIFLPAVD